ncbi:DUF4159 domain-containing protein [Aquimarina agarivorans]|uniref:DUF4159 domain-containing protein n=1 Tax=Aquimarina agarivorans TaxID=980584 RepID=UPI000248E79F|nr:DUF4159 domain-containing protein [Aquimarina agarivorans]
MNNFYKFCFLVFAVFSMVSNAQKIAVLHYNGGGDWYSNPTALPNLIGYCNTHLKTTIDTKIAEVTPESSDLFDYPYIHATGHGNILFNDSEVENLRTYLLSGGFLHIDDNYGMEKYAKREITKLFPDTKLVPVGTDHPIFKNKYSFPKGLPKIHEHDGKQPQAMGIFKNGRLLLLFTYECDLGDGWESPEVHNDPPEVREKALKMGANIINYAFLN